MGKNYDNSGLSESMRNFYEEKLREQFIDLQTGPQGVGTLSAKVENRLLDWQDQVERKKVIKEAKLKQDEVIDCTFKPQLIPSKTTFDMLKSVIEPSKRLKSKEKEKEKENTPTLTV